MARKKLKIGQSLGDKHQTASPEDHRARHNRALVIWTLVVPIVLMILFVVAFFLGWIR